MKPGVILVVTACVVWWILIASSELDFYYKLITGLFVCLPIISLIIVLWCNFSKRLNATPNKARLTTLCGVALKKCLLPSIYSQMKKQNSFLIFQNVYQEVYLLEQ